ncbi:MAG: hypothetical protein P8Z37_12475 [Acidobacteriota bacterium]|jgi:hypothetical protein
MKKILSTLVLVLMVSVAAISPQIAIAQDNSPTDPAAVGSRVRSMIELGSVYTNIYDIAITVLETVRGTAAMDKLKAVDPGNGMPADGHEYVLARIKFEFNGRYVSDNLLFDLGDDPLQWVALSSELTEYPGVSVTVPKPALSGVVKPGDTMEGWVAFAVEKSDSKPVMVFDPDTGGATGRGRTLFFKLYK